MNAIQELAHQVLAVQSWTDYARGLTVSVGDIRGGGVTNVSPRSGVLQGRSGDCAGIGWPVCRR
ncbi:MAG: hypothetical protein IPO29_14365 [Anaerolineae bacterium]|nr:hypothetical protein [Anaerolineae bacterium]